MFYAWPITLMKSEQLLLFALGLYKTWNVNSQSWIREEDHGTMVISGELLAFMAAGGTGVSF